ncbi:MAG: carbon starvation CstA family protein [Filifactoraceae bacterium]
MITFIVGLAILIVGGIIYGKHIEKVFGPDDRKTPAFAQEDGVDFVPMDKKKNSLIQLLNIAGTGPIVGPIQGILFGPIAFILIPVGCVLGGAVHDYISGMMSLREQGAQMPALLKRFLGVKIHKVYSTFLMVLMILVGAVFIYTPGDLTVTQIMGQSAAPTNITVWIVYAVIFIYYLCATLFPIDKIIGKLYPIFGAILLLSAVGVFFGMFIKGYELAELNLGNIFGSHPKGLALVPFFFVTVACGIVSGFHSTQSTLIARSVKSEREGRTVFFNMMLLEGFIAMVWAAAAMGVYNLGIVPAEQVATPAVIGIVARDLLGPIGGFIAIVGVIVLPITSGDTALRSLRLMVADQFKIDQRVKMNRISVSAVIFALVAALLAWAKFNSEGFNILWRYFAWANQTVATFAFFAMSVYLASEKKNYFTVLIPGAFYCFVVATYILNASIGFRLPMNIAYVGGAIITVILTYLTYKHGEKAAKDRSVLVNISDIA